MPGASNFPTPGASSKHLPEPAWLWDCGGGGVCPLGPCPSQEQGCLQGGTGQEDGGDAQGW